MGTIKQTVTRAKVRKSKTKPKNCPVCGKFMGNKGRASAKVGIYK